MFLKLKVYPRVMSIAGSDSGGCAGIQADVRVLNYLNCHASTVQTAVTAQNTLGVQAIESISAEMVTAQIDSVMSDIGTDVIKIGMLCNKEIIIAVAQALSHYQDIPIILDPVMVSTSKHRLLEEEAEQALVEYLFPRIHLLTPNHREAEILTSHNIHSSEDILVVCKKIHALGVNSVLITGGDCQSDWAVDYLYEARKDNIVRFEHRKILTKNTHGAGCSLSAAIAGYLAKGLDMLSAIQSAKSLITIGLEKGKLMRLGKGAGPLKFSDE